MTRDDDIRFPLVDWLKDIHRGEPETAYLEELKMFRPSARADLAVVNGEFIGYEIKSDLDRLERLEHQIPAYTSIFEKVNLVTTKKHLSSARAIIPKWWGIIIYESNEFQIKRQAKKNRELIFSSLLFSLTVLELQAICNKASFSYNKSWQKRKLVKSIEDDVKYDLAMPLIRDEIRNRHPL